MEHGNQPRVYDVIVEGSEVGGGTLALAPALRENSVLLTKAGGDTVNNNSSIPTLHTHSTEPPACAREFFVHRFSPSPDRDITYHPEGTYPHRPGIFYLRASGLAAVIPRDPDAFLGTKITKSENNCDGSVNCKNKCVYRFVAKNHD